MAMVRDVSGDDNAIETNGILLISAGAFAIYLLAVLGVEMTRAAGNVASIWLPNIVALAMLYRLPRGWIVPGLVIAFSAILAANLSFGDSLSVSAGLAGANLAEIALSFTGLRLIGFRREDILSTTGFVKFLAIAGLAAPAAGALAGASVLNYFYGAPMAAVFQTWWLSGLVGAVVLGPAIVAPQSVEAFQKPLAIWEIIGWAVAATALVWLINLTGVDLLVYLCPLLVVFAGIRVGLTASGFAGGLFSVYLAWVIVEASAGTATLFDGNLLEAQIFLLASMSMANAVAILWHQQVETGDELKRYVDALQDTDEAILFVDADFTPLSWNQSLQELLPTVGSLSAGGRAAYREQNLALLGQLRAGKVIEDMPISRPVADGSMRHFLLSARSTYRAGLIDGAILRYRDVTREVALTESIEGRVAELEAFLDASDDVVLGTDAAGRINIINQVACEFHGLKREEALGRNVSELEDDKLAQIGRFEDLAEGRGFRHLRLTRKDAQGRWREVERTARPILDKDGQFAGIAGVQRDITDLVEKDAEVQSKEALLDKALSSVTDAIAIFDKGEVLVRCNPGFAKTLGYDNPDEIAGIHWVELSRRNVDAGIISTGDLPFDEWIEQRRSQRHSETQSRMIPLADGVWHLGRDYPTEDGGFVAIRQDITDIVNARDELARSNSELEQFAFVASHDLQEPLRKICAFGSILEEEFKGQLDQDGQQYLQSMINGATRMQTLIKELLTYSRVARDNENNSAVDLAEIAQTAQENLALLLRETNASVVIEDLGQGVVNRSDMVRVFQNLITNAIRYADPERAPEIRISRRNGKSGTFLIDISDNGIGFDLKYTDQIFQPFKRLHGQSQIPGTGMGLSIVRKIIFSVGGDVSVRSVQGEGSVFTLMLPQPR